MSGSPYAIPAIVLITVATVAIGAFGYRISRSTSDFLVASRTVSPRWNASAISGEYLSAASFLGVAGLVMMYGVDMLWYPVGFTAGYLAMLLYVAAPLRRSGAYTLPDFAEARLRSPALRTLARHLHPWRLLLSDRTRRVEPTEEGGRATEHGRQMARGHGHRLDEQGRTHPVHPACLR